MTTTFDTLKCSDSLTCSDGRPCTEAGLQVITPGTLTLTPR